MSDPSWVKYNKRALIVTRKTAPPFEEWVSVMETMNQVGQSHTFWLGDLYLVGEQFYGEERATSIMDSTDWNLKTLQNAASICRRIEPTRRREELSYSHHAEVGYLEPDEQDYYLQKAIDNQLSVTKLRNMINYEKEHGLGSADNEDDVAFKKRTIIERIGSVHTKLGNLLGDLPEDWDAEHQLLTDALHLIDEARNSANNRAIGEPEQVRMKEVA